MAKKNKPGLPTRRRIQQSPSAQKMLATFVDKNVPQFNKWLHQIAEGIPATNRSGEPVRDDNGQIIYVVKPDPLNAFKCVASVVDYVLPKLSKTDIQQNVQIDVKTMSTQQLMELREQKLREIENNPDVITLEETEDGRVFSSPLTNNMETPEWMK